MTMNGIYLFLWVAYVHHRLQSGIHAQWFGTDVIRVIFVPVVLMSVLSLIGIETNSRLSSGVYVVLAGLVTITSATLSSSFRRESLAVCKSLLWRWRASRG